MNATEPVLQAFLFQNFKQMSFDRKPNEKRIEFVKLDRFRNQEINKREIQHGSANNRPFQFTMQ